MAITRATGFPVGGGASLSVTVANAGDLMIAAAWLFPSTARVTGVASTLVPSSGVGAWTQAATITDGTSSLWLGLWWGVASGAGADTITFTTTGSPSFVGYFADELNSPLPHWLVTTANTSSGDNTAPTWPSLTPMNAPSAYWGFTTIGTGTLSAGTTTGFAYTLNGTENLFALNGSVVGGTAYQPSCSASTTTTWDTVALVASAQATNQFFPVLGV